MFWRADFLSPVPNASWSCTIHPVYYGHCGGLLRSIQTLGRLRTNPDPVEEVADGLQS
jgi:hypothetical protein